jgi:hypothetical protein
VHEILKQASKCDTTTPGLAAFKLTLKASTIYISMFLKKCNKYMQKHKC